MASEESQAQPEWRRLHPASLLINLLPQFWMVLRAWWPLLLAVFIGASQGILWLDLLLALFFFGGPALRTVVHWFTLRYRVHDERLEIRTGLLNRRARIITPDRIQNSELVTNPMHRLFGLVEVRLETAGGEQTEGLLSALTREDAGVLMEELEHLRRSAPSRQQAGEEEDERTLLGLGPLELMAHGLSARRVGVLVVVTVVGLEVWQQLGLAGETEFMRGRLHPGLVAGVVLASYVLGVLLAIMNSLLRHHGFRLVQAGELFRTEQGLLTRRRVQLPARRIQLLRTDEPLLRRLMGYGTLYVETAGLSVGPDGSRQAEATIPMVDRAEMGALCHDLVPAMDADPWGRRLHPAPLAALLWAWQRALVKSVFLMTIGFLVAWPLGLLAIFVSPFLAVGAWLDWRWQAWLVTPRLVISRRGFWVRRTWILPREKVQSAHRLQGPTLRIFGLAQVVVRMAGNQVLLPALRWADAGTCLESTARKAGEPADPRGRPERDTFAGVDVAGGDHGRWR